MTALNFPISPSDEDTYDNFIFDAAKNAWKLQVLAGNDLDDLNDVSITTPESGQALVYDSSSGEWINETPEYTVDILTDTTITTPADGELLTYDGAGWVNEVPATITSGDLPAGSVLQVVSTTKTDTFSGSFVAGGFLTVTGLTASIIPTFTSSKILVFLSATGAQSTNGPAISFRLTRGGSPIAVGDSVGDRPPVTAAQSGGFSGDLSALATVNAQFLDAPATDSSVTYGIDAYNASGAGRTFYLNRSATDASSISFARAVSTITLMEVAG